MLKVDLAETTIIWQPQGRIRARVHWRNPLTWKVLQLITQGFPSMKYKLHLRIGFDNLEELRFSSC